MDAKSRKLITLKRDLSRSLVAMQKMTMSPTVWDQVITASEVIKKSYLNDGSLFVAGNGGSAADAQHLVAELVSRLSRDRSPIRAFAMTVDSSILTAVGNDYGYEILFSRQVEALMRPQDIFLGITTSGNSKNILKALVKCREMGITSIIMTGPTGGKTKDLADYLITVPSEETQLIQEGHSALYHALCQLIEDDLIEAGLCKYAVTEKPKQMEELTYPN
ncbi:MAG: SIS domain-containing protein [Bdellovibrionia bacterium]